MSGDGSRTVSVLKRVGARLLARTGLLFPVVMRYHARRLGDGAPAETHDGLPLPPPHLLVASTNTADAAWYFESGAAAHEQLAKILPDPAQGRILDFGCGCGRVLRRWRSRPEHLVGLETNPEVARWSRRAFAPATVLRCRLEPPTPLPDAHFDGAYALSVFTHLTVRNQRLWLRELRRLLRPSAPLVLTLHGDALVDALEPAQRSAYRNGEIVVTWREAEGTNLCGAYHPAGSLEAIATGFRVVEHLPSGAAGNAPQDLYVLERL